MSPRTDAHALLARLVADHEPPVAAAAAEEILRLAASAIQTNNEQLLTLAAAQYHVHRRQEILAAILERAPCAGPDLEAWLADESQPAHMALRSMLRRDDRPGARAGAVRMLARASFAPAACDRLRRADDASEHAAALALWPLLRHPRRRRALARLADGAPLLPVETDVPRLPLDARLGRVQLVRTLRMTGEARAAALAPCLADDAAAPKLAAVATLGAGPLTDAEVELLRDFTFDHDARVARSAAAALLATERHELLAEHWGRAGASPHACVREIAALAPSADFLRDPVTARLAMLREPDRFIIVLRARIARAPAQDRLRAIALCRRLGLAPRAELELLGAAADADARVASAAARTLGGAPGPTTRDALIRLAMHPDPRVRANAVEAARGRSGVASMIEAKAADPHHRVRSGALAAWFHAAPDLVAERLRGMLADDRPEERLAALWAARAAGVQRVAPDVARIALDGASAAERRSATRCARALLLGAGPSASAPAVNEPLEVAA
ncbi:MAG: HEAT repeat domain-containing protein [Phycisphaerales bacterium]|nr:HEAT repeat domain-containing protein [Phycisphaerales bacterium]